MNDYKTALSKGLDAAKAAEENKNEINFVFEELNKQLSEASDGKLKVYIGEFYVNNTVQDFAIMVNRRERETYESIVATNPLSGEDTQLKLSKWEINRNGYPARIHLEGDEFICEDKESLEINLQELLSDPIVGDKLYRLIQQEPKGVSGDDVEEEEA